MTLRVHLRPLADLPPPAPAACQPWALRPVAQAWHPPGEPNNFYQQCIEYRDVCFDQVRMRRRPQHQLPRPASASLRSSAASCGAASCGTAQPDPTTGAACCAGHDRFL